MNVPNRPLRASYLQSFALARIPIVLLKILLLFFISNAHSQVASFEKDPRYLLDKYQLADKQADIIGLAKDIETGNHLYQERHFFIDKRFIDKSFMDKRFSEERAVQVVVYHSMRGDVIAAKELIYEADSGSQPLVRQMNYRAGEWIEVVATDNQTQLNVQYRESFNTSLKQEVLPAKDNIVIDAGFNNVIRSHWQSLNDGEVLIKDFLIPSRQNAYSFKIYQHTCSDRQSSVSSSDDNAKPVCFIIKPKAWWISAFVDPIELGYDKRSQTLIGYRGLGNIADESGNYLAVDLKYNYFSHDAERDVQTTALKNTAINRRIAINP